MKRCAEFLRSVLPSDLTQLIFLCGVVCLFMSAQLRWFSTMINIPVRGPLLFVYLAPFGIQLAAAAGYFLCFRTGERPARSIFWLVCAPALIGIIARCGLQIFIFIVLAFDTLNGQPLGHYVAGAIGLSIAAIESLGPGFHYALFGLILIALFRRRAAAGLTSLPLALPKSSILDSDDQQSWQRWLLPIWLLLYWLVADLFGFPLVSLIRHIFPNAGRSSQHWLTQALLYSFFVSVFIGLAFRADGKQAWLSLRRYLRLPLPETFLLAIAFPVVAVFLGSLLYYPIALGRSAFQAGVSDVLKFSTYFALPTIASILSLVLPAFAEEAVFRGLLQLRFIRRYGVARGIFLVSVVWAAWHFAGDFGERNTDLSALTQLSIRLPLCISMGMVLGWLTLRTGSILPATVAHAIYNSFVDMPDRVLGPGRDWLIYGSWGLLAFVLFRHWPAHAEAVGQPVTESAARMASPG